MLRPTGVLYLTLHQSTIASVNHCISQPLHQSTIASVNHSLNHCLSQPLHQSIIASVNHCISQPLPQSTIASVNHCINHPLHQPLRKLPIYRFAPAMFFAVKLSHSLIVKQVSLSHWALHQGTTEARNIPSQKQTRTRAPLKTIVPQLSWHACISSHRT